jgi:hypothetical protein
VTLRLCEDIAAADWITHSRLDWRQLVAFGPGGFDAYARLRFLPDPAYHGQSENDAAASLWRSRQLPILFTLLGQHTSTPDDCHFCVWEGFTDLGSRTVHPDDDIRVAPSAPSGAEPALAPEVPDPPWVPRVPRVEVPNRAYWLFQGPLADVGRWESADGWPEQCSLQQAEPAFVWPEDRAWLVANDVDPHWAGIGGTHALIEYLAADPRLDVVPADPGSEQPSYW